ncbi:MAG: FAD binding domain-containing protein [Clostridia bacterium]|nr:FAD binding domain-containing protein [Clostridia bacterium]
MKYHFPHTVESAVDILTQYGEKARLIAGGTDLILDYQSGKIKPDAFVDISKIEGFDSIHMRDDYLVIGGGATHSQIATSELVTKYAPALALGCSCVGSRQIRNIATLSGNIVNAQPAADGAVPLAVLDADLVIYGSYGQRTIKLQDAYAGFGKSTIDSSKEIISEILIPTKPRRFSAFNRLELRKALALPMLNCAASAVFDGDVISEMRIVSAPVGIGPVRATEAEDYCTGKTLTDEVISKASQLVLSSANPRSNPLRGSREYRLEVLPVLIADCLQALKLSFNKQKGV